MRPATHPADLVTLALLVLLTIVTAGGLLAGAEVGPELLVHGGLLTGYALLTWRWRRRPADGRVAVARGAAVVLVMGLLYGTLAVVAFRVIPWRADAALYALDRALFLGASPALVADAATRPWLTEALAFFYAAYVPFLYFSIFLGLVGRAGREREEFVLAFTLLYSSAYLGYLFAPAYGPIVELAGVYGGPLEGGRFLRMVRDSIDSMGGPHGAFPSLHVGASFLITWFELRHDNELRGLIYAPMVLFIALATIVLRYHWVVDLVAGILLALLASHLAARLAARMTIPDEADAAPAAAVVGAGATP